MRKIVITLILFLLTININSQRFIQRSIDIGKDVVGVFTPESPSPTNYTKGFPEKDPSNVQATEPGVPIVESILGIFGLGAVYAYRLIKKKK